MFGLQGRARIDVLNRVAEAPPKTLSSRWPDQSSLALAGPAASSGPQAVGGVPTLMSVPPRWWPPEMSLNVNNVVAPSPRWLVSSMAAMRCFMSMFSLVFVSRDARGTLWLLGSPWQRKA